MDFCLLLLYFVTKHHTKFFFHFSDLFLKELRGHVVQQGIGLCHGINGSFLRVRGVEGIAMVRDTMVNIIHQSSLSR